MGRANGSLVWTARCGLLGVDLEISSKVLGGNDLLIAAQVAHRGATLIMADAREFQMVPRARCAHDWNEIVNLV